MGRYRVSMIPKMFSYWWENLDRPHRLLDQRFAVRPHRTDHPFLDPSSIFDRRLERQLAEDFWRPWNKFVQERENGWSTVKNDEGKFYVSVDIKQFKPDEISIKIIDDNFVVVEGKHKEQADEHDMVSSHFTRIRYMIPEQCDPERVASTLSSDGVLTITVPVKPEATSKRKERVINVEHTGKPAAEDKP